MINNFSDFCDVLMKCGFSMGGGNPKGIYAVIPYGWQEQDSILSPIKWHTGELETDPWEWRMRVLEERDDIAYSKLFFRSSGYITKDWYPYFYAVRRNGETFDEAYENGKISGMAKQIYAIVSAREIPLHEMKQKGGFSREDNAKFERALVELQMRMFITMCGRTQKKNKYGEGYGWNSTVFTTVENFWYTRAFTLPHLNPIESYALIKKQILKLNPQANQKVIDKFIRG